MEIGGIDWSKFEVGKIVEGLNKEEKKRRLGEIMIIIKLQIKINNLKIMAKDIMKQRKEKIRKGEERKEKEKEKEEEDNKRVAEQYKRNEREREERKEQKRIDKEWRNIERIRVREERKAKKEQRCQEMKERRREERRQIVMKVRRCFSCGGFGHMASHCRSIGKEGPTQTPSNRFEVLKNRVMQRGERSRREVGKNRREILREEKVKREVEKVNKKRFTMLTRATDNTSHCNLDNRDILREVTVKIGLERINTQEGITVKVLLDSGATELVMSLEFT